MAESIGLSAFSKAHVHDSSMLLLMNNTSLLLAGCLASSSYQTGDRLHNWSSFLWIFPYDSCPMLFGSSEVPNWPDWQAFAKFFFEFRWKEHHSSVQKASKKGRLIQKKIRAINEKQVRSSVAIMLALWSMSLACDIQLVKTAQSKVKGQTQTVIKDLFLTGKPLFTALFFCSKAKVATIVIVSPANAMKAYLKRLQQ